MKSPGIFQFNSGIRSSSTRRCSPIRGKSPVYCLCIGCGQVKSESAPVVPVEPEWHIQGEKDCNTTDSHTGSPRTHEKEREFLPADMPDQRGNQGIGDNRDENVPHRNPTVLSEAASVGVVISADKGSNLLGDAEAVSSGQGRVP